MIEAASTGTDQGKSDLAKSTYGFLFFGTPHRGLETVDLKCMVEENRCQSRGDLLDDIKRGSRLLEEQLSQFIYWIGDRKIISFVEMQQTKELQKVREIKYLSSCIQPKWADSCWFSRPLQLPLKQHTRKYRQGPVIKAQHPNLLLIPPYEKNKQSTPTSRSASGAKASPLPISAAPSPISCNTWLMGV